MAPVSRPRSSTSPRRGTWFTPRAVDRFTRHYAARYDSGHKSTNSCVSSSTALESMTAVFISKCSKKTNPSTLVDSPARIVFMWIYLWLFLSSPQLKALVSFSDQNFSVVHHRRRCHRCCCHKVFSSSPLPCGQFQPNKSIFNEGYASFLNEGPLLFRRWDNYEIEKIHRQNSKIIICRTSGQISTKLSTNHPWLKGSTLFQMEIIAKFQKYIDEFNKSTLPEPLG